MKKVLVFILLLMPVFAEDKPKDQPTLEQRFELMQLQRDFLLAANQTLQAQTKQLDAGNALDQKAAEVSNQFSCAKWNADFTCIPKTKEEKKADKK